MPCFSRFLIAHSCMPTYHPLPSRIGIKKTLRRNDEGRLTVVFEMPWSPLLQSSQSIISRISFSFTLISPASIYGFVYASQLSISPLSPLISLTLLLLPSLSHRQRIRPKAFTHIFPASIPPSPASLSPHLLSFPSVSNKRQGIRHKAHTHISPALVYSSSLQPTLPSLLHLLSHLPGFNITQAGDKAHGSPTHISPASFLYPCNS